MRASPSYVWRWAWLVASAGSLCASAASPEVSQLIRKFQGEESGFVDHVEIANEIAKVATLDDVSSLEPWLAHEDRHVRGNAAYLFAKLGDRRGLATIEGILTDYSADRHVRWQGGSLIFQGNGEEAMAESYGARPRLMRRSRKIATTPFTCWVNCATRALWTC